MRADYEPLYREWKLEASAWDARQKVIDDAAWARYSSPSERALHNIDRFFAHYFFTDGKPDPSKTRDPVAIIGHGDPYMVSDKAERIPGLEARRSGDRNTLCIGWDRSAVWALADQADAEVRRQEKAKADDRWAEVEEEHAALVKRAKTKSGAPKVNAKSSTPAVLQKIIGSYVVRCSEIEEQWPSDHDLTLDIGCGPTPDVVQAAVEFNVIEGTMILGLTDSALDEVDRDASGSEDSEEDDSEEDDSEEDDSEEDDQDEEPPTSRKRAPPAPKKKPGRPKKPKASPTRRILLRIRGRETGEGETFYNSERGYLEFTDDTFTRFAGVVSLPCVGSNTVFEGFKVDLKPQQAAEPFEDFSEEQYEDEGRSRWGGYGGGW